MGFRRLGRTGAVFEEIIDEADNNDWRVGWIVGVVVGERAVPRLHLPFAGGFRRLIDHNGVIGVWIVSAAIRVGFSPGAEMFV